MGLLQNSFATAMYYVGASAHNQINCVGYVNCQQYCAFGTADLKITLHKYIKYQTQAQHQEDIHIINANCLKRRYQRRHTQNGENIENDGLGVKSKVKLPPWVSPVGQGVVDGVDMVPVGVGNTASKVGESVGK